MTHQVSPMGTFFTPALPGTAYDILCLFAYTPVSEALVLVLFLLYHLFLDLNNDRFVSSGLKILDFVPFVLSFAESFNVLVKEFRYWSMLM